MEDQNKHIADLRTTSAATPPKVTPEPHSEETPPTIWGTVIETLRYAIIAAIIILPVRYFIAQPFVVSGQSMFPTFHNGEYLIVDELSKYIGTYHRGDVVILRYPNDPSKFFIKRVIGLPGDHIQMKAGVLFINGGEIKKERIEDYIDPNRDASPQGVAGPAVVAQFRETLPNGVQYNVLDYGESSEDNTQEYVVPENRYFMMGDNRDNSADSRFLNGVGYVPIENFVGHANVIFFSFKPEASLFRPWEWPLEIRWSRFFNWVR